MFVCFVVCGVSVFAFLGVYVVCMFVYGLFGFVCFGDLYFVCVCVVFV